MWCSTHDLYYQLLLCDEEKIKFTLFESTHYSKSQIFVQKFNFVKTLQFSREIKVVND